MSAKQREKLFKTSRYTTKKIGAQVKLDYGQGPKQIVNNSLIKKFCQILSHFL